MKFFRLFLLFLSIHFFTFDTIAQSSNVTLYANRTWGMPGDTVRLDIRVNGFTDIISFQASLNWDASMLKFLKVSDFGIRDFDENNFGTTAAGKGHVRFIWEPADAISDTLQDSTILFRAHFEVIGSYRADVAVSFVDESPIDPFPIEFVDSKYNVLTVKPYPGNAKVILELSDLVNLISIANTSCDDKLPSGSLKADVDGDTLHYTFLWYAGDSVRETPDHTGPVYRWILDGTYTLRVLDENDSVFIESMPVVVLRDAVPRDTIRIIVANPQTNCNADSTKHTGAFEITINSGQDLGLYNISWWKDNMENGVELTPFRDSFVAYYLDKGPYEIVVKNIDTGCRTFIKTSVADSTPELYLTLTSTVNNYCKDKVNGSATAMVNDSTIYELRYFWFMENEDIDTLNALARGPVYDSIPAGNYRAWVIDLPTQCVVSGVVTVEDSLVYYPLEVTHRNDTLFANNDMAAWFRDGVYLNKTGPYLIPDKTGDYHMTYTNEFGCFSESAPYFYQITALAEEFEKLIIYPNPFVNMIRISNPEGKLDFVKVYDTFGRLIVEKSNIKDQFTDLYLTGSPDGIYLIKIGKEGKTFAGKVVKNLSK